MEDSASVGHQNRRKRSSDNNAFAKFVPVAEPLGVDDGASQKANPGHDNDQKRHKPNSEAPLSEIAFNFSTEPPLSKQTMGSDNLQFSSPSTSSKHSTDSRPSPPSIGSKSRIQYEEIDVKSSRPFSADQIELGSMGSMTAEQLSKRPKIGGIYKEIAVHRGSTLKRLKDLCNKEPTIDVGIEMADAACLLKLMSSSTNEIEIAGQKAHRGAMLLLQAEMLRKNGLEMLAESQNLIGDTL